MHLNDLGFEFSDTILQGLHLTFLITDDLVLLPHLLLELLDRDVWVLLRVIDFTELDCGHFGPSVGTWHRG